MKFNLAMRVSGIAGMLMAMAAKSDAQGVGLHPTFSGGGYQGAPRGNRAAPGKQGADRRAAARAKRIRARRTTSRGRK